jgi:dipeptidyl aminopeptidase/acylaminoacyl peptidase
MLQTSFRRRAFALAASVAIAALSSGAALAADGYQAPPAPIAQILDAAPTPSVAVSPDRKVLAQLGRENLPSIAAVSEPILRLGGYRINPRNNGPIEARSSWMNALSFQDVATGKVRSVALPAGARFLAPSWSPDGGKMAFVMDGKESLELWVVDVKAATARKASDVAVSGVFGAGYDWLPDGSGFLVQAVVAGRGAPPVKDLTPTGPTIQESKGRMAAIRTYQDLLTNAHDEALFDYYFTAQLTRVDLADGKATAVGKPGVISGFSVSPDGQYVLTNRLKRPYSYLVPASQFPTEVAVSTIDGRPVKTLVDRPLADNLPAAFDAVPTGVRSVSWRADAPATLVWAEAQDGGDPRKKVAIHDSVFMQAAPFDGAPTKLIDLEQRYRGVEWGRGDVALLTSRWWQTRNQKLILIDQAGRRPHHRRSQLSGPLQRSGPRPDPSRRAGRGPAALHAGRQVGVRGRRRRLGQGGVPVRGPHVAGRRQGHKALAGSGPVLSGPGRPGRRRGQDGHHPPRERQGAAQLLHPRRRAGRQGQGPDQLPRPRAAVRRGHQADHHLQARGRRDPVGRTLPAGRL